MPQWLPLLAVWRAPVVMCCFVTLICQVVRLVCGHHICKWLALGRQEGTSCCRQQPCENSTDHSKVRH